MAGASVFRGGIHYGVHSIHPYQGPSGGFGSRGGRGVAGRCECATVGSGSYPGDRRHGSETRDQTAGRPVLGGRHESGADRELRCGQHRGSRPQRAIRGVSSGQVIRDQPGVKEQVGVYLDESPISVALFTPDLELFDLDRFEVLRGPQGTLFGAGSDAGTVRYITKQPKLGAYEAYGDASLESPTGSGSSVGGSVRAAFNAPLGPNAAVHFVAYEHHLPGFIRAIEPTGPANSPSTTHIADGVNDGDRAGFRLSMLWKPSEELSVTPRLVYQNLGTNGFPRVDTYNILANPNTTTQPPVTIGDREQYTQLREGLSDDFRLADVKVDYNLGPATLTSVSSLTSRHVLVTRDASQLSGSVTFQVFGPIAQVRLNSPLLDHTHLTAISQELRVASNGTQTFDWLLGAFYQHVGRRYGQALPTQGYDALNAAAGFPLGFDPLAPPDNPFYSDLIYRFKQYALFGEATYHITDPPATRRPAAFRAR
ncbi:MAG: hypothetical protein E6K27_15130 [Gammaproteobacteria bacterium]|nr:MAG: hypothetical protein E6K27_15130 [Gammaproteobacteria bacterium]